MLRIKELRESRGIDQKVLAIDIGVSQPTVSDWESGRKSPASKRIEQLADYFGVTVDYLLGRSDEKNPGQNKNPAADDDSWMEEYARAYYPILDQYSRETVVELSNFLNTLQAFPNGDAVFQAVIDLLKAAAVGSMHRNQDSDQQSPQ